MNPELFANSQRRVFICLIGILVSLGLAVFFLYDWKVALLLLLCSHACLLYAQLTPGVQLLGAVVTHFATQKNELWLTIDDGPEPDETLQVLDLLDQYDAKATFFVIARKAEKHPEILEQILKRGHQLGNHSLTHPESRFWCLPKSAVKKEVNEASSLLTKLTGTAPLYFRAPVGHKPLALHPILTKAGLPLIGWTARGFDGVLKDSDQIVARISKDIEPGTIVLLHEGRDTLVTTLKQLLAQWQRQGYRCVLPPAESLLCGRR
ncbi:MAG: polysaccharide deacetylase family protein [Verrucomicrobiales bacterium]|nr:polysaccharide deacetylase family protein [Verrucomicrobiales bacterium]